MKACCTKLISVVNLVTKLPLVNLSTFLNEKLCTLVNIFSLKFAPNPIDATAANLADNNPKIKESIARAIIIPPYINTTLTSPFATPSSIINVIILGIRTSQTTSSTTKIGAKIAYVLY